MGMRTKIITEYRQAGGDADGDGDTIAGMWWDGDGVGNGNKMVEMGTKYFTVSSSS